MAGTEAMQLYQLLGAPLHALIDAEAQAAMATADFIQTVGMLRPPGPAAPLDKTAEVDAGQLRMLWFRAERVNAQGEKEAIKIEVPLLSIVPIPALQIKDAQIDFFVKLVNALKPAPGPSDRPAGAPAAAPDAAPEPPAFKAFRERMHPTAELHGRVGSAPREHGRGSHLEMQMKVTIRMEQADVPTGLARLFNVMEQSVRVLPHKP